MQPDEETGFAEEHLSGNKVAPIPIAERGIGTADACAPFLVNLQPMRHFDNQKVRRQDRLLDRGRAEALLRVGEYGVLSMAEAGEDGGVMAYGIPVNFVWDGGECIYLHCAPDGRKLRCISRYARVSFCIVGHTHVLSSKFTTEYESVVLDCRARVGLPVEERRRALSLLLDKYSPADKTVGLRYAEKSFHRTEVVRLDILAASGKSKCVKG